MLATRGSRDRHHVVPLRQHPRERQLRRRASLLARDRLHAAHEIEILLEVLALKARIEAAKIVGGKVFEALDLTGEEAAAKRAVRHEADAERAARRQDLVLGIPAPEGIL